MTSSLEQSGSARPPGGSTTGSSSPHAWPPIAAREGATVVNPERRGIVPVGRDDSNPRSEVVRRLFPPESELPEGGDAAAGVQLDQFVIEGRIGIGGMGSVFLAADQQLRRIVALKVLAPAHARDASAVQRFQNESRAAARLDHDNIARVFCSGEDQGLHYIAYEFVSGINLRDLIRQRGRLEIGDAVSYTLQTAAALNHMAAAGVVHRDVKPSNIIVTPAGRAKLVDLGLARKDAHDSSVDLTLAGTTLGTFDYISPEQAKDPRNVDVRSDIYSLGCTLYHMLSGEPPYPEGTVLQKLLDHQGGEPPDAAKKNRRVPAALSAIVRRMMASDPRRRYAGPDELIQDLLVVAGSLGLRGVDPDSVIWIRPQSLRSSFWERNVGWILTAAALLLIVVALDRFASWDPGAEIGRRPVATDSREAGRGDIPVGPVEVAQASPARSLPRNDSTAANWVDQEPPSPASTEGAAVPGNLTGPLRIEADSEIGIPEQRQASGTLPFVPEFFTPPFTSEPFDSDAGPAELLPNSSIATSRAENGSQERATPPLASGSPRPQPPSSTGSNGADGNVTATEQPVPVPSPAPEIQPAIALVDGTTRKSFETLEAACREAREGQVIEVAYSGRRLDSRTGRPVLEKPLRIDNKRITITAAPGFRPLIAFAADEPKLISVINGSLTLLHLDLEVTVDGRQSEPVALLSLEQPEKIRLKGVSVTFRNPAGLSAAVAELIPGPGQLDSMGMMKTGQARIQVQIEFSESFFRGDGTLLAARTTEPARFTVEQSVIALNGSVLHMAGSMAAPSEDNLSFEFSLRHSTCLLGEPLITIDGGNDFSRELQPLRVEARDNVIATHAEVPLVEMLGSSGMDDFDPLLTWSGEKNYYDGWNVFLSRENMSGTEPLDFDEWKLYWGSSEVGASNAPIGWQQPWRELEQFSELALADAALEDRADNPPVAGAADFTNAGADLARLLPLFNASPARP